VDTTRSSVSTVVTGESPEEMPGDPTQHDGVGNTDEEARVPAETQRRPGD
jgi:hypothetical protein